MAQDQKKLIGKTVIIKKSGHSDYGNWGIVKDFDGEDFHVAMNDDEKSILVFGRSEFRVASFDPRA